MTDIEILKSLIFFGFAGAMVFFALFSLFATRIIYSLISAVAVFFVTAGIYFLLNADYNAVVQIAVYGIAIPILFVLALAFTPDKLDKTIYLTIKPRFFFSFLASGTLFLAMFYLLMSAVGLKTGFAHAGANTEVINNKYIMFSALSKGLFVNFAYAFELFTILLLLVVVGISTLNLIKEKIND